MSTRKIYVVGGATQYANWMQGEITDDVRLADLVVFTGGTDVDPALYREPRHPLTQPSDKKRDEEEKRLFGFAASLGKRMVGICRGAQFLCVMAGGKLIQHQENKGEHEIRVCYPTHTTIRVTSDHHQAQYPWDSNCMWMPLGYTLGLSKFHLMGDGREANSHELEIEDAFYPEIKALCIQSHPEWQFGKSSDSDKVAVSHYQNLLNLHMAGHL